jgi:transglutaminase-like putative cysteine protease
MSAVATPPAPMAAAPPREGSRGTEASRLVVFAALACFAAMHWAALVQAPPAGRVLLAVAVPTALGVALTALGRAALPRPAVHLAALGLAMVSFALVLGSLGLPLRLLWPGHWGELSSLLDRGLSGIRTVTWPYAGPEHAVRLAILLGAGPLLALAGALSFWPARRGRAALRLGGLVSLLSLYATAVTDHDPGAPLARGLVLFALVAAWLWLPRLRPKEALPGLVAVAVIGLVSLPLAARVDRAGSLVDYSDWNWFGGKEVTFDWNHTYGPLNWPRDGTTLLEIKSSRALYWKAEVLDSFDGLRWMRSRANDRTSPLAEMPSHPNPRWDRTVRVTVRSLRTNFVIGAGTPYRVLGAGQAVTGSADGTLQRLDQPLRRGDGYTVRSYVPTPTAAQMRAANSPYQAQLDEYTSLQLPARGVDALSTGPARTRGIASPQVTVPLRGTSFGDAAARRMLARSPYARAARLSRRLTAGAPTAYDAVRRVQDHFRGHGFVYSERPPTHRYPLESFLFADRSGYCQQFSGAMALLLRISGIPARVASGFSPGSLNRDTGQYRVRDLDAHSWVEVYFEGIGWVTFDPTPPAAPADRAGQGPTPVLGGTSGDAGDTRTAGGDAPASDRTLDTTPGGGSAAAGHGGGGPPAGVLAGLAALLAGMAGVLLARRHRGRRGDPAEDALRELERALPRLGWAVSPTTTLLELERRLDRAAGPASARYVSRLRAGRYAPVSGRAPSAAERRALRRELTARRGPLARLRGFLVLPPRRRAA